MSVKTSQFLTVTGLECVQHLHDCGCWYETYYTTDGEIELIRLQLCKECVDSAGERLQALDNEEQLTLYLPST